MEAGLAHTSKEPADGPAIRSPGGRLGGFWSLIVTQFQGAFSDNALKWLVGFLVLGLGLPQQKRDFLFVLVVPLLFAVPFLLFSMAGGYLADRFSKRSVTIALKCIEIAVMGLATAGLALGRIELSALALFLLSTQAALFGPSKYGLLPELLPESRLSWGNGILELGTFLAAITGTLAAGLLAQAFRGRQVWSGIIFLVISLAGLAASAGISRVPAAAPRKRFRANVLGDVGMQVREIGRDRLLKTAVVGNVFFWFLASLLLLNIVLYAVDVLRVDEAHSSYLLASLSLGIGVGSVVAGYLSERKIEYGLVPIGMLGIAAVCAVLALPQLRYSSVTICLAVLGLFGGLFAVPVNALIQHRPEPAQRGGIIAAANLLSFVGIALQPVAQYAMLKLGHPNPSRVFLISAGITVLATAGLLWMLPDMACRMGWWLLTNTRYRLRVTGRELLPERDGAVLVLTGPAAGDQRFIAAAVDRPTRFVVVPDATSSAAIAAALRSREYVCLMRSDQFDARELARVVQDACEVANLRSATLVAVRIERNKSSQRGPSRWPPLWRGVNVRFASLDNASH
jgi:acyl-[acyl-carrier-protein]-phospholipid O-acyltransferase / long-chain-fatty-acid--[acyl-carrier-protein] ligase